MTIHLQKNLRTKVQSFLTPLITDVNPYLNDEQVRHQIIEPLNAQIDAISPVEHVLARQMNDKRLTAWDSITLGKSESKKRALLRWADQTGRTLSLIDMSFLQHSRRQGSYRVPVFAIFNMAREGKITIEASLHGWLSTGNGKSQSFKCHNDWCEPPLAIVNHLQKAVEFPWRAGLGQTVTNTYRFSFSGAIPDNIRQAGAEVKELGVEACYLVMEVPAGQWQINTTHSTEFKMLDPLLIGKVGSDHILFDCFDLTPVEEYVKREYTKLL